MRATITGLEPALSEDKKEFMIVSFTASMTKQQYNQLLKKTKGWIVEIDIKIGK